MFSSPTYVLTFGVFFPMWCPTTNPEIFCDNYSLSISAETHIFYSFLIHETDISFTDHRFVTSQAYNDFAFGYLTNLETIVIMINTS